MDRRSLKRAALPFAIAAATALAAFPTVASADDPVLTGSTTGQPPLAALLNAGTARTGIGPTGVIGVYIDGPVAQPRDNGVQVAGVQAAEVLDDGGYSAGTVGIGAQPSFAAMLNAGTAWSGIGPAGKVGDGIVAAPAG